MQKTLLAILILLCSLNIASAQDSTKVIRLEISEEADDFSPVMWNDYLIFQSERQAKLFVIEYKDSNHEGGVNSIFKAKRLNDTTFTSPEILSKEIQSNHHDGPASFTNDGKKMYYSRPVDIGNSNRARLKDNNRLAIFEASWDGSKWNNITMLSFCDTLFDFTHPAISPNGDFMVFASNKLSGKGNSDLFISRKKGSIWSDPEPLSSKINSKKRDWRPYIHYNGDLYFSSNRKGDFDIYRCRVKGSSWENPVALQRPINSSQDEYSIYLDKISKTGYLSSNRDGYFDLYYFEKPDEADMECDSLIEESFCYTFPIFEMDKIDGLPLIYQWEINGELLLPEAQLMYCFPEAGRYTVKLNIVDTVEKQVIFVKELYDFLVGRVEQPYVSVPDVVKVNEIVDFDGSGSYLPNIDIEEFLWEFGDGEKENGVQVQHVYTETGNYRVSLSIFGAPIDGIVPQFCSYKFINVSDDEGVVVDSQNKEPLDLKAFIRMIEYEPLPEDLYYLNLIGSSDNVMMINFYNSDSLLNSDDPLFSQFTDSTKIHIFENDDETFSYYYGASFTLRDAYHDLVIAREAGFPNASIKNFKYTKLQSEDYYLDPVKDAGDLFAVVLKRSQEPIEDYEKVFKKVPSDLGKVRELYVEGEGYYYVVGNEEDLNNAFSVYSELRFAGINSLRIKDFKEKNVLALYDDLSPSQKTSAYMIELFEADDYLSSEDSIFDVLDDRSVLSLRVKKKKVAYYVNGGANLLEAKSVLMEMKKRGYKDARISNFEYEKLNEDGFFISKLDDGTFTYIITFDSSATPLNIESEYNSSLLGYKIYERYDPLTKMYYYQVDVGQNLPEAVLLSKDLMENSTIMQQLSKLTYDRLSDDEFYLDLLEDGDEQYVLVLGSFDDQQNVYKTFKGFSACSEIREFYDAINKEYVYIVGGYESLEEVFVEMEKCKDMGMEDVYIQKFVYDPLDPDQFYLQNVNEEEEIFRITLNRTDENNTDEKATSENYDALREDGVLIDSYDKETQEFVVALGKSKSLPGALSYMDEAIEKGYNSIKVQRYIYSSMDQDRFVIRDLEKEDRYMCVELFHTDTLLAPEDPMLRELSRKYPIAYSYNEPTKDFVYVMGPLENVDGALTFLKLAKAEGFSEARIMAMIFQTLEQDEFYLEEVEDVESEFVLTLLQTKNQIDTSDAFFNSMPKGTSISELKDKETGYYHYMIRNLTDINEADSMFAILSQEGYPNVRLQLLTYDKLNPDEFTLETISDLSDDFTVTLIRSKEKLSTDNSIFAEIKDEVKVFEYYNYKTKEYIYSLGKVKGMIAAFKGVEIAAKYGFTDATVDRFVYSTLNPDHFSLETIDENDPIFTIIIENGNKKYDKAHFKALEEAGFEVREKYVPSKNRWTYSIGLTSNIAEANRIVELAKSLGYRNAEISRFRYQPLNDDKYYLSEMEDIQTAFMLELESSDTKQDLSQERFENVNGVYKVSEVYDPIDKQFKYYAGQAIYTEENATAFQNELIAMGFFNARVSKFIYTSLKVDEFYLNPIEIDDKPFVLEDKDNFEVFVYFGFDQYFLRKEAVEKLKDFYTQHYDEKYQILLEGYTDSIGDEAYNMWLSRKRALSVKKYLLAQGVKEENITLVAKGESEPIFIKPNVEDHKKSRRVLLRSYRKKDN